MWSAARGALLRLEFDAVLNRKLAGSRHDLRRGPVSPEEDHDDPAPTVAAPAPMRALFGSLAVVFTEDSDTLASWLAVLALVPLALPSDHHRAANDRQDDSTHPYTLPRLPWSRSGLLRRHVAQSIPNRPGVADRRQQDAEGKASRQRSVDLIRWAPGKWKQGISQRYRASRW